jgi:poly-gamma-glutamate capsule biosynthesis protein CapA/YwtB (metallophosphatase superfamily)
VLAVVTAGAGGFIYRSEIADMVATSEESPQPTPTPSIAASPTRTPEPSPSPSPSPSRGRLVVHGIGDVSLDPNYIPNFRIHGYRYAWTGLRGMFRKDDLTVVNLECAVSNLGFPVSKDFNFRCDPKALPVARKFGVEVANLANNHGGDFGKDALLDSRKNLGDAGILPVGVGRNDRVAIKPAVLKIDGWTVAVLGFGGVVPQPGWIAGPDHPGMADGNDIKKMVAAIKAADKIADLVFVTIHWGKELDTEPRQDDVERAHAMIRAGADGIFGHHSHRLNPLSHYRGRPIAWGLGNFVWPNHSAAGNITAVARIVVRPNGKVSGRLIGAYIDDSGHPVLTG